MVDRARAVIIEDSRVLLMHRCKSGREYYSFPGGGIEPGESPEQACIREVLEETGLDVEIVSCLAENDFNGQNESFYLVKKLSGEVRLGGPELDRLSDDNLYEPMWVPIDRMAELPVFPKHVAEMVAMHI
ncbi:NUDIX domain-containing protein [bacterium]|nr:NUDIX domain-containing protein [bacterium]